MPEDVAPNPPTAQPMPGRALPNRQPHTRVKHEMLCAYVDEWYAVLAGWLTGARKAGPLLIVDGFAGPGRYDSGEPGSPLMLLDRLVHHRAFPNWSGVEFRFVFTEKLAAHVQRLEAELTALPPLPANVSYEVHQGAFEVLAPAVVRPETADATFMFLDPFGYSNVPMPLSRSLLDSPRTEALIFLPVDQVARFLAREGQESALRRLFGTDDWEHAIATSGQARRDALTQLFEEQLRRTANVKHTLSFRLTTAAGADYRLVFATGHDRGLQAMKNAMWRADPANGAAFRASTDAPDALTLFGGGVLADTRGLGERLRERFGTELFTKSEGDAFVLVTRFRAPHLTTALRDAEAADRLEVVNPKPGRRKGTFKDATMRFLL